MQRVSLKKTQGEIGKSFQGSVLLRHIPHSRRNSEAPPCLIRFDRRHVSLVARDVDADLLEMVAMCGGRAEGDGFRLACGRDAAAALLARRFESVTLQGPRGGLYLAKRRPMPELPAGPAIMVDFSVALDRFPDAVSWDVLAWKPGMHRPRFVSLAALVPGERASSAHRLILLRAKRPDKSQIYVCLNTLAGSCDAAWDRSSREGWSLRVRLEDAMLAIRRPLIEPPTDLSPILARRPRAVWLQRRLQALLPRILVVDASHTAQPPRLITGSAVKMLKGLARLYGEDDPEFILVVDTWAPRFRSHVLNLAASADMLDPFTDALGIDDPLTFLG